MKNFYAADASTRIGQLVQSSFRLTAIDVKAKRNGEPFVWLMLEDSSGSIEALVWDMQVGRSALDLSEGDIVGVVGKIIGTFQERLQLAIDSIFLIPEPQVDAGDYPPASDDGLGTVAPNALREKWTAMGERARKNVPNISARATADLRNRIEKSGNQFSEKPKLPGDGHESSKTKSRVLTDTESLRQKIAAQKSKATKDTKPKT